MRTFRSDNNAGICPEAMAALQRANDGHQIGYGDDECTARAVAEFKRLFGNDCAVYFVATGTAANTLAIASLTDPWQQALCHAHSHINDDESTAPERLTHCRISAIHTPGIPTPPGAPRSASPSARSSAKITVEDLKNAAVHSRGDVHQPQPGVFSVSNTTEFGEVYSPAEMTALCDAAHALGYRVHVDGARFANAVAAANCHPRDLANRAGVDALSFGGTKNGFAMGEAVVFFPQGDGRSFERAVATFEFHRKGTGHLLSKHRFVSAPFEAVLADGSWLRHAAHANTMAAELARGLAAAGICIPFRVQANAVFVQLPAEVDAALKARGHGYYPMGHREWGLSRLMCSFDTTPQDVAGLIADVRAALGR